MTGTLSVVVATLNRPEMLLLALDSVACQSRAPEEIVIVDDGSAPPVDAAALARRYGQQVRVARNDSPMGLAWARHQGVELARGDYIVHLDDDDLYEPPLLAECARVLDADPAVDLVFIGVLGFGQAPDYFNRVHPAGTARVIDQGHGQPRGAGLFEFDSQLVRGLLSQVPMPFQRVMARREAWHKVTRLRWAAYRTALGLASDEAARHAVRGTLRDSEWALYAALSCRKMAYIDKPLYLQRCDGQGGSSRPAMRLKHIEQSEIIKSVMNKAAQALPEMRPFQRDIRDNLALTYFDAAFAFIEAGMPGRAVAPLRKSFLIDPGLKHLKLLARLCLALFKSPAASTRT